MTSDKAIPYDGVSRIYEQHGQALKGFISRRVPLKEEAEDILQDVFYSLSKIDLEENPIEQISAWLYRVARNRITDRRRKKGEQAMPVLKTGAGDEDDFIRDISELLTAADGDPEAEFLSTALWAELEEALDELPAEQKTVFELTELQGFSFREISSSTGIAVNTLISRKRYAVLHLRERLRVFYDDLGDSF